MSEKLAGFISGGSSGEGEWKVSRFRWYETSEPGRVLVIFPGRSLA